MSLLKRIYSFVFRPIIKRLSAVEEAIQKKDEFYALSDKVSKLNEHINSLENLSDDVRAINLQLELLEGYESLCENVRNINSRLEGLDGLCENVRNLNIRLEGYEIICENIRNLNLQFVSYEGLCENVRNLNLQVEGFEKLSENVRNLNAQLEGFESLCENVRNNNTELSRISEDYNRLSYIVAKRKESPFSAPELTEPASERQKKQSDYYSIIDYFQFENYFRGPREDVKNRQKIYLEYFRGCKNILDIGCGRGEFLELMRDNGLTASGVDTYPDFVGYCCSLGFDVSCVDGIEYLRKSDKHFDGIYAGQLVEHLTLSRMNTLIEAAYEKLTDGGVIVIETPNPQSLSIYVNAFYVDPSHEKPVHPETLSFLLKNAGFRKIEIKYTESSRPGVKIPPLKNEEEFNHSMKIVQEMLFGSQDYAIIARK